MTGEHLETLTREELIDLILQLQSAVTEVKAKMAEHVLGVRKVSGGFRSDAGAEEHQEQRRMR